MSRLRNCCFTINNPKEKYNPDEDGEDDRCHTFFRMLCKEDFVSYVAIGQEVGLGGTPHWQGYVEFKSPQLFKFIHEMLLLGHLERRRGTAQQASDYCCKDGICMCWGDISNQGKRNDLDLIRECVSDGDGLKNMIHGGIVKNYQGLKLAEKLLEIYECASTKPKPKVFWYYGKSGSGKSYDARAEAEALCEEGELPYYVNSSQKWFPGYDKHKYIIVNDVRDDWKSFSDLLNFLDEYPYNVEIKGGSRSLLATHIWLTSAEPPWKMFQFSVENMEQLTSRITICKEFTGKNQRVSVSETQKSRGNTIPLTICEDSIEF